VLPDRIPRGWGYPPPRPPVVSGLAVLVLVTVSFALVAPHARTIRASLAAGKLPAINLPGPLPRLALPNLPRRAPERAAPARPSPRARAVVAFARRHLGKPYRWGAEGPVAYDCSGLTWAAWRAAGVTIPRTAAGQHAGLPRVRGQLRPGDLLVYRTDGPSRRHVAMVIGPGRMVEARGRGVPVRSTAIRRDYLGAVRPGAGR
jgi:cell wall-associated NlpC family hydrolase